MQSFAQNNSLQFGRCMKKRKQYDIQSLY